MKRLFTSLFASRKRKRYTPPKEVAAKFRDVFAVEAFLMPEAIEDIKRCIVHPDDEVLPGVKCPENLNALSIGDVMDLSQLRCDTLTLFRECAHKVLRVNEIHDADVMELPAWRVYGFINFTVTELRKIGDLFNSLKTKPTPEQEEAGINELNFGAFGMIDCYALRMGITNHEEAAQTPWLNVFAAFRIDAKTREYKRRLEQIMNVKTATR